MAKSKEIEIEIKVETKSISELKSELRNLKSELANATDPKDMLRLASAAGEVQDKLTDVNEKIREFASGSDFEKASNSLKGVGSGLANLDFGKAQESAQAFAKSAGAITFKQAITSVKQFGQTMATIGKALLTNPLFLIGAIVAVIVIALYEFLDSLGLIKKAMDLLMMPLDLLIDGLKQVAEWLGINTTSAKEFAEENKKMVDSISADGQRTADAIQFEIDKRKAAGEETFKIERQKQAAIRETAQEIIESQKQLIKTLILTGQKDSEEYQNAIKLVEENVIKVNEANKAITINAIQENEKRTDEDEKAEEKKLKAKEDAAAKQKAADEKELAAAAKIMQDRIKLESELEISNQKRILSESEFEIEELKRKNAEKLKIAGDDAALRNEILRQQKLDIEKIEADAETKEAENQRKHADNAISLGLELKQKKIDAGLNDPDATPDEIRAQYEAQAKVNEEILNQDLEKLKVKKEAENLTDAEYAAEKANIEFDYEQKVTKNKEEAADAQKKIDDAKRAAINDNLDKTASTLEAFSSIAGKETAAGKTLAVASATINTYRGVSDALAATTVTPFETGLKFANAIAIGVAGLQNVQKILSVKVPGGGGGGGSAPSSPRINTPATPTSNTQQLFATQQLQGAETEEISSGGIGLRQQPQIIKAVVSERDVTSVQNRIRNYEQRAELG